MSRFFRPVTASAILATCLLAACSDAPTATAPEIAEPANMKIALPTDVTLRLYVGISASGEPATPTVLEFTSHTSGRGPTVITVADNSAEDLDKRDGHYEVKIRKSKKYMARLISQPAALFNGNLQKVVDSNASIVDFNNFMLPYLPGIQINQWLANASSMVPVAGGSFRVMQGRQTLLIVEDSGANDYNNFAGRLSFTLPFAGTFNICEHTTPAGYAPLVPTCFTMTAAFDQMQLVTLDRSPL